MPALFANIHLFYMNEYVPLENIDFNRNVEYLKQEIAEKIEYSADQLVIVHNGIALKDDNKLSEYVRPEATVHCFEKNAEYPWYVPTADVSSAKNIKHVQELFNLIAHTQINVNLRVNILQKILAAYPEFRRNLGAQALIRDSVLFNTLHHPEVIKNIAKHYPLICGAAPFIVDTIKKELARNTSATNYSEPATDSTNSSEEENSLGAGSSSTERTNADAAGTQSENARIRLISRQQLQAALAQIGVSSINSLSNIAQRNTDPGASGSSAPLSNSASGERISSELFRNELQRALNSLSQRIPGNGASTSGLDLGGTQQMDTTESSPAADNTLLVQDTSDDGNGDIPLYYRSHQYAEQLRTMAQMGFVNYEDNLMYLNITNGNIENAVNLLMGAMN